MSVRQITALVMAALLSALTATAAELNCKVEVNADQARNADQTLFTELQQAIADYLNTTSFTEARFATNEKIECRVFLTVTSVTDDMISGTLQVQSTRPVFDSVYTTTLLNFKDNDISFSYTRGQPLNFTRNNYDSELTALLDFYAYLIIALDFDSFSRQGGTDFYNEASKVVQTARTSGGKGWRAIDDNKNRASLLAGFNDSPASAIRDIIYEYHRQGLDRMSVSPDKGRETINGLLPKFEKIAEAAPMSVILSAFRDAKLDELVNIYSAGTPDERKDAADLLLRIYPTEQERINHIKESK